VSTRNDIREIRENYARLFSQLGERILTNKSSLLPLLMTVETAATAEDEIEKSVRALRTYHRELDMIQEREPIGTVLVSLPFNNPLYSLILYSFGPLIGGNRVIIRPSAITRDVVIAILHLFPEISDELGLTIFEGSGKDFIQKASRSDEVQGLIFAGNWDNVTRLMSDFPPNKRLIYCGSGINPFVVDKDALDSIGMNHVSRLIVDSKIYNSGQDCLCTERIFVHHTLCDSLLNALESAILSLKVGDFGDVNADINPLLGGIANSAQAIANRASHADWIIPFRKEGALVYPSLAYAAIDSEIVNSEKFSPVFTVAGFDSYHQLDRALDFQYMFGVTICGSYSSDILCLYPHVTKTETVISNESEDAHVPFGGRRRSGFVKLDSSIHDGPILYSVETTVPAQW